MNRARSNFAADWKYRYNRFTNRGRSPVSCFHRCLSHYLKKNTHTGRRRKQGKSTILRKGCVKTAKETEGGKADFSRSRVRSEIKGGPNVFSRPGTLSLSLSLSTCGPWKLLLTRPSLRETFAKGRTKSRGRPASVRRPESGETRNGFLRFRRWQDERRVICLLSVDDKAIPTTLHGCSPYPRNGKGGILAPFPRSLVQRLSTEDLSPRRETPLL